MEMSVWHSAVRFYTFELSSLTESTCRVRLGNAHCGYLQHDVN